MNESEYIRQIYKKTELEPPTRSILIENKMTCFEKRLKERSPKPRKLTLRKCNILQTNTLWALRDNKNLIIKPTDKNLGPAIMKALHQTSPSRSSSNKRSSGTTKRRSKMQTGEHQAYIEKHHFLQS
jgi:hypothetical protein